MAITLSEMQKAAGKVSALLKALANEQRLLILCQLNNGEKSVGELTAVVDLQQSALSQHLARLRRTGLVRTRRAAQTIFYSLDSPEAARVLALLYEMYCVAPARSRRRRATRA